MTLYDKLIGNGLIAFSDPAGAKAALSVAKILSRVTPCSKVTLVSNKVYPFFADWKLPIEIIATAPQFLPDNIQWIFTGTSHPESSGRFELGFIKLANESKIISWSFIDHWGLMALRFDAGFGKLILPTKIIVVDEYAKKLALEEGLPSEKLEVYKNPYLDYIENFWLPTLSNSDLRKQLNLEPEIPIILYGPDPLTLRGEDQEYGFDEGEVLNDLLQIVSNYSCHVLVKAHPLQPTDILERAIRNNPKARATLIKNQSGNLDLMANSNLIIGFYSNFLIEAAALGKKIIRYFPAHEADPIKHLEIAKTIFGRNQLQESIEKHFLRQKTT